MRNDVIMRDRAKRSCHRGYFMDALPLVEGSNGNIQTQLINGTIWSKIFRPCGAISVAAKILVCYVSSFPTMQI